MGSAKHNEITERLRREILSGKFRDGGEFPSGGQLAERFGVSRPTINRVMLDLRNEGLVATGSGRLPRLTRFAQHATGTLGIIHPGFQYGDVMSRICKSLVHHGERQGWDIVLIEMVEKSPEKRLQELIRTIRRFSEERVSGLFLQPFEYLGKKNAPVRNFWKELSECNMPVVLFDYNPQRNDGCPQYDLISMDNVSAGAGLGRYLIAGGAEKLTFLLKPGSPPSVVNRMRGVASAVVESGMCWSENDNVLVCEPDDNKAVSRFLRTRCPDAIICGNDMIAVRLHATLSALGRAGTVRLAGFDNQPQATELGITSVAQPCEEIASIALQTLLARLHNPALPVHTVLVPDRGIVV